MIVLWMAACIRRYPAESGTVCGAGLRSVECCCLRIVGALVLSTYHRRPLLIIQLN
jgi:hypothetical protein